MAPAPLEVIRFWDTLLSAKCAKGVQMRGQKHDTFSKEFREEAIRQAREERRPLTALARDLGVKYSYAAVVGETDRGGRECASGTRR